MLIDSWGFTLRVAQRLRKQDAALKLIKYVGPQVWASRPGRARTLAKTVDHLLSILAFDAPWFEKAGLPVTAVGNPVLAKDFSETDPDWLRLAMGAAATDPILLVLPGSRRSEIARLMGPFGEAVALLKRARPPSACGAGAGRYGGRSGPRGGQALAPGALYDRGRGRRGWTPCAGATVALACSGTVTTEVALAGCPMVVAYSVGSDLTFAIMKALIDTPYVCLLNIVEGRIIVPEMLQKDCTGQGWPRSWPSGWTIRNCGRARSPIRTRRWTRWGRGADPILRNGAADAVIAILEGRRP
ncbi:MAG: lipid-A-disaccharide synthase [Caulobacteraceae bacterium]